VRRRLAGTPARRGAFLVANHVSWLDIPVLSGATGTAFVAHSGLAGHGLLKWLCEMNDTVFVARHDRTSVQAQVAHVRAALSDTGALAIFPEGTTSDGTGMLPFKSSLLSAIDPVPPGIVVQPVWIDYGPEAAAIAWVGDEHGVDNFLKILRGGGRSRSRCISCRC
jgi:1-acyl-sn-glycerol-3-phosphate acyltransferase